jgi:hypothetical protein
VLENYFPEVFEVVIRFSNHAKIIPKSKKSKGDVSFSEKGVKGKSYYLFRSSLNSSGVILISLRIWRIRDLPMSFPL